MPLLRLPIRTSAVLVLALMLAGVARTAAAEQRPTGPVVFAAASLKNALDEVNQRWSSAHGGKGAAIS